MALKDVCRKPSIRILTKPHEGHISHQPTLLTIDWSTVTIEEYQMMAAQWVTTHYQKWMRATEQAFLEKDEVCVRWLLEHEAAKETEGTEIPNEWKGGMKKEDKDVLNDAVSKMTPAEVATLLAQLQQLSQ